MDRINMRACRVFLYTAALLLTVVAFAKIISSYGSAAVLSQPDPLLGIRLRYTFRIVAAIELVVASWCAFMNRLVFWF